MSTPQHPDHLNPADASRLREAAAWDRIAMALDDVIEERRLRNQTKAAQLMGLHKETAYHNAAALRSYVAREAVVCE